VPVWTLLLAVAAWVGTNLMVWIATGKRAKTILAGARRESVRQKDQVVAHFDEALKEMPETNALTEIALKLDDLKGGDLKGEIDRVEAHIQGIDNALGSKFKEWDEAMSEMPKVVAQHVQMALGSQKGVEMKALYKAAAEGEEELEEYVAEGLDSQTRAMAKVAAITVPDEWTAKHPLGAMLIEGGKEWLKGKIDEERGVVTLKKVGGRGNKFR